MAKADLNGHDRWSRFLDSKSYVPPSRRFHITLALCDRTVNLFAGQFSVSL
jgi:hypothetical protein